MCYISLYVKNYMGYIGLFRDLGNSNNATPKVEDSIIKKGQAHGQRGSHVVIIEFERFLLYSKYRITLVS